MVGVWLPVAVDSDAWLAEIYAEGARRLGVRPLGPTRIGGIMSTSISGPVERDGKTAWLRVAAFIESDMDSEIWMGTRDAAGLVGVARPAWLAGTDWTHPDPAPVPVRADLVSLVTDKTVVSADAYGGGQYPPANVDLPDGWWADLRASMDALAATRTDRTPYGYAPERLAHVVDAWVGELPTGITPGPMCTEHLDLHWGQLTAPTFAILDWEHWGLSIQWVGIANLYVAALPHAPATAARVREVFPELDSPAGRYARLVRCLHTLGAVAWSPDEMGLAGPLRAHVDELLGRVG
jgi:hypothetical protein